MPGQDAVTPAAVRHVAEDLTSLGAAGTPRPRDQLVLDPATAALVDTQLYEADGHWILVVVPHGHRADPINLAGVLGAMSVTVVPAHLAVLRTAQDPTAIAPIGYDHPITVIIDVDLAQHQQIWVPAGHPDWVFPTSYAELLRITAGTAAEVGELPTQHGPPTIQG